MLSILLIPVALCFTFGKVIKNKKQGRAIFIAMFLCLVLALGIIAVNEQAATPQLAQDGAVNITQDVYKRQVLHCMAERKEEDFMQIVVAIIGIVAAALLLYYVYILMKGDEQKCCLLYTSRCV